MSVTGAGANGRPVLSDATVLIALASLALRKGNKGKEHDNQQRKKGHERGHVRKGPNTGTQASGQIGERV